MGPVPRVHWVAPRRSSPGQNDSVSQVGLAVYSCADFANGYFNPYGNTARKDSVDFVVRKIREVDMDDNLRIWRSFQMRELFDLVMLDTRNYDHSVTSLGWNDEYVMEVADDASRTLMGSRQENWFFGQLSKSAERGATWRIIGNQIVFSRLVNSAKDGSTDLDSWDVSHATLIVCRWKEADSRRDTPPIVMGL